MKFPLKAYACPLPLPELPSFGRGLLHPVGHCHFAVHRRRDGEVLLSLLVVAYAAIQLTEAKVAMGYQRAHAAGLRERERVAVVGLAALGIEPVGMGCNVAEQVQRMGCETRVTLRGFDPAVTQPSRLVEPVELQTSATQRVVAPGAMEGDSTRRLTLEELLAFPEPVQRLARLAELRQCPGGRGDRPGKVEDEVPCPGNRHQAFNP